MARWKELERYCYNDGWECYKENDHIYFRKKLPDGTILRTKVSRGSGEIPNGLFKNILSKQLRITKEEFNSKI